ncbi:MAG: Lrp/AsnC family transcriptional regulator [Nocardioidaceae bacterium]
MAARHEARPARSGRPLDSISRYTATPTEPASVDQLDLRLLHLLSKDARTSRRRLAAELGMSAPAIGDRIARLERLGVITGYGVRLDWSALGYPTTVYLTITAVQGYEQGLVMKELATLAEVEEVMLVTGGIDMLVRLRVRDHTHLRSLLLDHIWQIEGIQRTETSMSIAELTPKNTEAELLSMMLGMLRPADRPTQETDRP